MDGPEGMIPLFVLHCKQYIMDNGVRRIDVWDLRVNRNVKWFATGDAVEGTMNNRDELAGGGRGVNSAPLRPGSGPGCGPSPNQRESRPEPVTVSEPALAPGPGQVHGADQCH